MRLGKSVACHQIRRVQYCGFDVGFNLSPGQLHRGVDWLIQVSVDDKQVVLISALLDARRNIARVRERDALREGWAEVDLRVLNEGDIGI